MAKYSVPGVKQTEIDNTIRTQVDASRGVGAIVMKANKGPVNQRVLARDYNEYKEIFGAPESEDDYGHFAADIYLQNSNALLAVRATMGDEQYAQVQFPYTDAAVGDKYRSKDVAVFKYVNNEGDNGLDLLNKLNGSDPLIDVDSFKSEYDTVEGVDGAVWALKQQANFCTIQDLIGDAAPAVMVSKATSGSVGTIMPAARGKYIKFIQNVAEDGTQKSVYDDLILTAEAWNSTETLDPNIFEVGTMYSTSAASGQQVKFNIPKTDTLNGESVNCQMWLNTSAVDVIRSGSATYAGIFNDANFYKGTVTEATEYCTDEDALKLELKDWDDCYTKTHYVLADGFADTCGQAAAISYREYGMADKEEKIVMWDSDTSIGVNVKKVTECTGDEKIAAKKLAESYGLELADISNDKYSIISYIGVWEGKDADVTSKRTEKIIFTDSFKIDDTTGEMVNKDLFWIVSKQNSKKISDLAVYTAKSPEGVIIPWQDGMVPQIAGEEAIKPIVALPTTEVLTGVNETYRDGYTLTMAADDEPGNGDIEQYRSNKDNQLVIAAIGPGNFGNDIGISIITPSCAEIAALNHQNAFNWKYRFDDEDLVDQNAEGLTWQKVYRVNVYVKTKTQTAEAAWGTGLDALVKDPVEYFYVSNDPRLKDNSGNSLYAPNVINGVSRYIYVSRTSTSNAMSGDGNYALPEQTYAIYGLTGGANSRKNNVSEKTAALKLFADRQKASFDILFNVEAINTFNGRQRFAALQRRMADIAAARTMDIAFVQCSSTEAKTAKRMLSELKAFAFTTPSYVAPCVNYDKYYNSDIASWVFLPKTIACAAAEAYCQTAGIPWMAPAGTNRGLITYSSGQLVRLTDDEIGQLYDNCGNTSRQIGNLGDVIWGQKTALKKESALSRINVRCCMNFLEKNIEFMMQQYIFDNNTPNTRASVKNTLDSFLSRVKAADGIIDYSTSVVEDPDDEHVLLVNITVQPAESIEFIDVKIYVTRKNTMTITETVRNV